MPPKNRKAESGPATVEVTHPDPDHAAPTHYATTPRELNDLVVGSGYKIADGTSLQSAAAKLAGNVSGQSDTAGTVTEAQTTTTPSTGGGATSTGGTTA